MGKQTVVIGYNNLSVPMYRKFNERRYCLSLLNPMWGSMMKAEAEAKATSARKAGWSIRVVKVGIPVYGKADYSKPGKPQRRPLTKEGYLLYERKTKTMKSSIIGKKCISSDIGRRSGDRW